MSFKGAAFARAVPRGRNDRCTLCSLRVAGEFVVAAAFGATDKEELRAVRKSVLDRVIIKILVHHVIPVVTTADGMGFHRPGFFHPAALVDLMDVEITIEATTGPEETMEPFHLVQQLRDAFGIAGALPCGGAHATG